MKTLATLALLFFAAAAQAQLYRCVDAKGKVQYSDKPLPGCKAMARQENAPAPQPAAPKPGARAPAGAPAKPAAKVAMTPEQRAQNELRCRGLEQEREFLSRRREEPLPGQEERRGQVEAALARECR